MNKPNDYLKKNNINISYNDAINMISKLKYVEPDITAKMEEVEKDESFPKTFFPFYEFLKFRKTIPSFEQMWRYYLIREKNQDFFNTTTRYIKGSVFFYALEYRACKAYPSYVRELLFILLVKEKFTDYEVIYDQMLDFEKGIDILLIKNDVYYGVKLRINTSNSLKFAEDKLTRHNSMPEVNYINFDFDMFDEDKLVVNHFFLYSEKYLDRLRNDIAEINKMYNINQ